MPLGHLNSGSTWTVFGYGEFSNPNATDNCSAASVTCSPPSGTTFLIGSTPVVCIATDGVGNSSTCSFQVIVRDLQPPVITCPNNMTVFANSPQCSAIANYTVMAADNCSSVVVVSSPPSGTVLPLGTTTITSTATDSSGNATTCTFTITVENPSPTVAITTPSSGTVLPINTAVSFCGSFSDNAGDTHTAQRAFDNIIKTGTVNETAGTVMATHTFTAAGVYLVTLMVSDSCGNTATADTVDELTAMVVIYDPEGGFVTGGGWINSPVGAYMADPSLFGKASFGFVSKYLPGATVPTGNTEFQFRVANFNFKSSSYEWLVVAGARAQYKGTGTINGSGNHGFILTAIDGQVNGGGGADKFRIKIWDKNNNDAIVYDNQINSPDSSDPTTVLGGGSIVIHKQQ